MSKLKKLKNIIIIVSVVLIVGSSVNIGISYFQSRADLAAASDAVNDASNAYRAAHDAFLTALAARDRDDADSFNAVLAVGEASEAAYDVYEKAYNAYQAKYNKIH